MNKIQIKLERLEQALLALEDIYLKPNVSDRSNIDATIQRFEFTFELYWKVLQEYFRQQGVIVNYPKDILREAFSSYLIQQEQLWLQMLQDRNLTSHTYDQKLADQVFTNIKQYVPMLRQAYDLLLPLIAKL